MSKRLFINLTGWMSRLLGKGGKEGLHPGAEDEICQQSQMLLSLEPRMMFDGAGVVSAAQAEGGEDESNAQHEESTVSDSHPAAVMADGLEPGMTGSRLVFVDPAVQDYRKLVDRLPSGYEVVLLDPLADGVRQIGQTLAERENVREIHILSHGERGTVVLGSTGLNLGNIERYGEALRGWSHSLTDDADIFLYGCDVAEGKNGEALVSRLAELTGADIAASIDNTGHADLGGDWDLEMQTGPMNAEALYTPSRPSSYAGLLETFDYAGRYDANGVYGTVGVDNTTTGEISVAGDVDWIEAYVDAGVTYQIDLQGTATGLGSLTNPRIVDVYDSVGTALNLGNDDANGTNDARTQFSPTETGLYYIAAAGDGVRAGTYTLALTAIAGEPNDSFGSTGTTSGTIDPGQSLTGMINNEGDADWYQIDLQQGLTYQIDVQGAGSRHGSLINPNLLGIYDILEFNISAGDDDSGGDLDARKFFIPDETGTYYIAVGGTGAAVGSYTLTVSSGSSATSDDYAADAQTTGVVTVGGAGTTGEIELSQDIDWLGVQLAANVEYQINVMGAASQSGTLQDPNLIGVYDQSGNYLGSGSDDGGLGLNSLATFTPSVEGTYYIGVTTADGGVGTYQVTVGMPETITDDHRADVQASGVVAVGGAGAAGNIETEGDVDWLQVNLTQGTLYRIAVNGSGTQALSDPYLVGIHDASGNLLGGTNDNDIGLNAAADYTAPATGSYFIGVRGVGPAIGQYLVTVQEVAVTPSDDYLADATTTGRVAVDGSVTGNIETPGDNDWFRISMQAGSEYRIDVTGDTSGQGLADPYLAGVFDSSGTLLGGENDNFSGTNARGFYTPALTGYYYIGARGGQNTTGSYTLAVTVVTPTIQDDYAANSTTSGAVLVGRATTANIETSGDSDWIKVNLIAGVTYQIDVQGASSGSGTLIDPVLDGIYNGRGTLVGEGNDDTLGTDAQTIFTPTVSGSYYIAARGYNSHIGTYTVQVTIPQVATDDYDDTVQTTGRVYAGTRGISATLESRADIDWFAIDLRANTTYQIDLQGVYSGRGTLSDPVLAGVYDSDGAFLGGSNDDAVGTDARANFTAPTTGRYYIAAQGYGNATGTYTLSVTQVGSIIRDDYADNDSSIGRVAVNGAGARGTVNYIGDRDWIGVYLNADVLYEVQLKGSASGMGTLLDTVIDGIYNAAGGLISDGNDDYGNSLESRVEFMPSRSGLYFVSARGYGANVGSYTLFVNEQEDIPYVRPIDDTQDQDNDVSDNIDDQIDLNNLGDEIDDTSVHENIFTTDQADADHLTGNTVLRNLVNMLGSVVGNQVTGYLPGVYQAGYLPLADPHLPTSEFTTPVGEQVPEIEVPLGFDRSQTLTGEGVTGGERQARGEQGEVVNLGPGEAGLGELGAPAIEGHPEGVAEQEPTSGQNGETAPAEGGHAPEGQEGEGERVANDNEGSPLAAAVTGQDRPVYEPPAHIMSQLRALQSGRMNEVQEILQQVDTLVRCNR